MTSKEPCEFVSRQFQRDEGTKSRGEPGFGFSSASGEFRDDWSMLVE